jgi:hypothetical protein
MRVASNRSATSKTGAGSESAGEAASLPPAKTQSTQQVSIKSNRVEVVLFILVSFAVGGVTWHVIGA